MTNNVHVAIEPPSEGKALCQIMKGNNLSYAQQFKNKYHYTGYIWPDRFKSIIISKVEFLLSCGIMWNKTRFGQEW